MTVPSFTVLDWNSSGVDANGVIWKILSLTGWDEPPPARSNFTSRPNDQGAFDAPVYDDVRVIGWSGSAMAPNPAARAVAKIKLGQVARALRDGADVIGHMPDGDYTVRAKRAPGWQQSPIGPLGFQYQLVVTCVDPYKYGPSVTATAGLPAAGAGGLVFPLFATTGKLEFGAPGTSGQITLSNPGTTEAYLTFTIAGPVLGGVAVSDTASGRRVVYADDIPAGANLLIIDTATGRATLNGADRTGSLTVRQWWPVPANGSSTVQFATLGAAGQSGTLSASLRPAYE